MFREILVPLDGTPAAEEALLWAARLARSCGAHLEIARVVQPMPQGAMSLEETARARCEQIRQAERYLTDIGGRLRAEGVRADWDVVPGEAARGALRCAADIGADLIVLRSAAGAGGSVQDKVIACARCPVLIVPAAVAASSARPAEPWTSDEALIADTAPNAAAP